jgi:hypothetical protein
MAITEASKFNPLTAVDNGRKYLDTLANKYVVKPKNSKGIFGFVFDYEGEATARLQAEITDHYSESNTVLNDHIALRPLRITLRGFVSELMLLKPQGLLGALAAIQNKLTTVPAYLQKYTPGAIATIQKAITKATNVVNTIDQSIARVKNIVGLFSKSAPPVSKQEKAYIQLQSLFFARSPMLIETPYGAFGNMVIESLSFVQDETTRTWSDISVGLKQINFVQEAQSTPDKNVNRRAQQDQAPIDKGKTQGKSLAASFVDAFKASNTWKKVSGQ